MTVEMYPNMVRLDPAMKERLVAIAAEQDRTLAQTIRRACRLYIEAYDRGETT